MFRSMIRKLARVRGATPRRSSRAPTRRPTLEALEDRLVLSTATQFGSTLFINADAGSFTRFGIHVRQILLEADLKDHTRLDVFDTGTLLGQFKIASIKAVEVRVAGLDAINVDDSNGLPFAPLGQQTSVSLFGSGFLNSLNLVGSQAINPGGGELNEGFTGGSATQDGSLELGGLGFQFTGAIGSVADEWVNTSTASTLFVVARGQVVTLTGSNGLTETLSGLASGGGGGSTLTFAGKANVVLEVLSDNATVTLNATAAAPGLKGLDVQLDGKNDTVNINATPSTASTEVQGGQLSRVDLLGNAGFVIILGNSTTTVELGSNNASFSQSVTSDIKADVDVLGASVLLVLDGGNVSTQEHVKVTESTVSGTGLFGNNGVVLHYSATPLVFFTGQLANTYTVAPTHPGARFSDRIVIDDAFSAAGLSVLVDVDGGSGLDLHLFNTNPKKGSLFIAAPGGKFNPLFPTIPNGIEKVTFTPGLLSTVAYDGFGSVGHS